MKKLLLVLLFIPLLCFGQTKVELSLCLGMQARSFISSSEAKSALDKILSVVDNYNQNFVMIPCSEINNAAAIKYNGVRYILYDKEFMKKISSYTNDWSNLFILAHEVGHHYYDHTQDIASTSFEEKSLQTLRDQELEADSFAGSILNKLGASIDQTLSITNIFPDGSDTYSIHPNRSKRRDAVNQGYYNSTRIAQNSNSNSYSAEYFYQRGLGRNDNDSNAAISDFTRAIQINPKYIDAYIQRSAFKYRQDDFSGAIEDQTTIIELDQNDPYSYVNRATSFWGKRDFYRTLADAQKTIELQPNNSDAYFLLGSVKIAIFNDIDGCLDLEKAIYLQSNKKDHSSIFKTWDSVSIPLSSLINAKKTTSCGYVNIPQKWKNDINSYIIAYKNSKSINYTSAFTENIQSPYSNYTSSSMTADEYYERATNRTFETKNYSGAISDYTKYLEIESEGKYYAYSAYRNRGIAKENLGDLEGACADWREAVRLGNEDAAEWVKDQCGGGDTSISSNTPINLEQNYNSTVNEGYSKMINVTRRGFLFEKPSALSENLQTLDIGLTIELKNKTLINNYYYKVSLITGESGYVHKSIVNIESQNDHQALISGQNNNPVINNSVRIIKGTINGKKNSGKKYTLPGAVVRNLTNNSGISSNFDGDYSLEAKVGDLIEFSYTKLQTLRIKVPEGAHTINVTLIKKYSFAQDQNGDLIKYLRD